VAIVLAGQVFFVEEALGDSDVELDSVRVSKSI